MLKPLIIGLSTLIIVVAGQQRDYTTPVPILKQINKHNEDGSYSYGYEGADGSFKIETKFPNGEVYGKYGYVDDGGKLREVEYGASRRGFEPQGNDINVPPPTLTNSNPNITPLGPNEEDDGQYREDPSVYYTGQKGFNNNRQVPASNFRLNNLAPTQQQHHQQQQQRHNPPTNNFNYNPAPVYEHPQPAYNPPQPAYNPPRPAYNPPPPQPTQHRFQEPYNSGYNNNPNGQQFHHPALQNINIETGSYSVSYTG